jgi:hypothetical protein
VSPPATSGVERGSPIDDEQGAFVTASDVGDDDVRVATSQATAPQEIMPKEFINPWVSNAGASPANERASAASAPVVDVSEGVMTELEAAKRRMLAP